jgi:hypothetical protein
MHDRIPLWLVASIGRYVSLVTEFAGPCETYSAGSHGLLCGITVQPDCSDAYILLVALDPNDLSYLENFGVQDVRPVSDAVLYSLDLQAGYLERLPSVDADRE